MYNANTSHKINANLDKIVNIYIIKSINQRKKSHKINS